MKSILKIIIFTLLLNLHIVYSHSIKNQHSISILQFSLISGFIVITIGILISFLYQKTVISELITEKTMIILVGGTLLANLTIAKFIYT